MSNSKKDSNSSYMSVRTTESGSVHKKENSYMDLLGDTESVKGNSGYTMDLSRDTTNHARPYILKKPTTEGNGNNSVAPIIKQRYYMDFRRDTEVGNTESNQEDVVELTAGNTNQEVVELTTDSTKKSDFMELRNSC
jgi:hypothetical protein